MQLRSSFGRCLTPMLVTLLGFAALLSGCTIKIAPSTQSKMANLSTQRTFALAYASAVKTPGVVSAADQATLATKYLAAAGLTNTFVNTYTLQVNQTSPGGTIAPDRIDGPADAAATALQNFVNDARAKVEVPRVADFAATAAAIALALRTAQELATQLTAWWNAEAERQRKPWIDYGKQLEMPIWPSIPPVDVPRP